MKLLITVQGVQYEVDVQVLDQGASPVPVAAAAPAAPAPAAAPSASGAVVKSPISGTIFQVRCKPGDVVKVNDTLLVIEAMKMESNIPAPTAGRVKEITVKVGDHVSHGQVLVKFE